MRNGGAQKTMIPYTCWNKGLGVGKAMLILTMLIVVTIPTTTGIETSFGGKSLNRLKNRVICVIGSNYKCGNDLQVRS